MSFQRAQYELETSCCYELCYGLLSAYRIRSIDQMVLRQL